MPPSILPRPQMRRAASSIGQLRRRYFANLHSQQGRLHHHLAGKLHPRRPHVHSPVAFPPEPPHPAVKIPTLRLEKQPAHPRQHRIPQVAVQKRHRSLGNPAAEPVAHHKILSLSAAPQETAEYESDRGSHPRQPSTHTRPALRNSAHQRAAVSLLRHPHDPRAFCLGNLGRPVRRTIVGDNHFARHAGLT
jgi:hypothetical protein